MFKNSPLMVKDGVEHIRRFKHSPVTINHYDVNASITEDGKVVLKQSGNVDGEQQISEVKTSASLIFKLVDLLNATRQTEWVPKSQKTSGSDSAN